MADPGQERLGNLALSVRKPDLVHSPEGVEPDQIDQPSRPDDPTVERPGRVARRFDEVLEIPTRSDLPIVSDVAPGLADCGHDLALLANFQPVPAEQAADEYQDRQTPNAQLPTTSTARGWTIT